MPNFFQRSFQPLFIASALLLSSMATPAFSAEQTGVVQFGGLPIPGATVTATQGDKKLSAVTDGDGKYRFTDLADGVWNFNVEMLCFETIKQDVTVAAGAMPSTFELKLLPLDQIRTFSAQPAPAEAPRREISVTQNATPEAPTAAKGKAAKNKKGAPVTTASNQNSFQRTEVNASSTPPASGASEASSGSAFANQSQGDLNQRASDGLLINGSQNNGASSQYAQAARFGNNVRGIGSLYNGNLGVILDNSSLDARTYSLTGQNTPKPGYNHIQGVANFGGPIRIPHLIQNGPTFFVFYQWMRNHTANTQSALMPTPAERAGDFSAAAPIYDPTTGAPFPGNIIPTTRISPQAQALLKYYPLPNFNSPQYNFQIPIVGETHSDSLNTRLNKNIGNRNQLYGTFGFQRTKNDNPNIFGFLDKSYSLGTRTELNYSRRVNPRTFVHLQAQFNEITNDLTPNFANQVNVSGNAGITGNLQDPLYWGPPFLNFRSVSGLTDAVPSRVHNQFLAFAGDAAWTYGRHNITYGADIKRTDFNNISQQNPRGTFTFTGAATAPTGTITGGTAAGGSDVADFLLGVPDTSQIAFGNADKYFRSLLADGFVNDDWRVGPSLTLNGGVRWEYQSPISEKYGRLVNLDVAQGFASVSPVVATNPVGPLTLEHYPGSLLHPDRAAFEPRAALAWRPIPASSLVVRANYGVYRNTSVYQTIATQMAQQAPLSKSLIVSNTPATPLSLANGFNLPANVFSNTFGIDPNFRVGYAQNWSLTVQRDLPASMVVTVTYLGIKGTRGPQEFYPNTFPTGGADPCPSCPRGFTYETSNGNSTRESGRVQLRRRLRNGFTASVDYTYSKSIDDSALGGGGNLSYVVAQNWLNLSAERALSSFDQRHNVQFTMQYTTGQGIGGGTLLSGWRGAAFKEWTITSNITAGSGLPLTPFVLASVARTGQTGSIRPDYTGAALYDVGGFHVNPAAFVAPPQGQWGNAGRDSVTGPNQFTMNASMNRTFRLKDRYSLDAGLQATNILNHVNFGAWGMTVNSPQFGVAQNPGGMRTVQTTLRVRF